MINLTKKSAGRFRIKWNELPERKGDFWKIDVVMIERIPMLLLIHEYTLFTLVRRKSDFKTVADVAGEIRCCCPWYKYEGEVSCGKNSNRKLPGSINQIKKFTWVVESPDSINSLEMDINNGLYSYLSYEKRNYGIPFEAVELYAKGQWPEKS